MKIVVIGGTGLIGSKLVAVLRRRGSTVVAASPDSGVNALTGEGLAEALRDAVVVVDVSNSPSFEDSVARNFFEIASRNLLTAELRAGVGHHVVLSIVGADRLPDSGYLSAKVAQERTFKGSAMNYSILRSTQFFEFVPHLADSFTQGNVIRTPVALVQPIHSDDVVAALADSALAPPINDTLEVAGPQSYRFDALMRHFLDSSGDAREVATDSHARYLGTELHERSLLPFGNRIRIGATSFENWLERSVPRTVREIA